MKKTQLDRSIKFFEKRDQTERANPKTPQDQRARTQAALNALLVTREDRKSED